MFYDEEPESWRLRKINGLVGFYDEGAIARVFGDIIRLDLHCYVSVNMTQRILKRAPSLRRLALVVCRESVKGGDTSISLYKDVLTEITARSGRQLNHLTLIIGSRRWSGVVETGASQELVLPITLNGKSAGYPNGNYCDFTRVLAVRREDCSVVRAVLCADEESTSTNPLQAAYEIASVWGSGVQVQLVPCFQKPSQQLLVWMKHVEDIRLTLLRAAGPSNQPRWARLHKGDTPAGSAAN